jgi:hypothetical protein
MTRAIDDRACRVVHVRAVDAAEEWNELRFFLRAWQARHGVEVSLRPDQTPPGSASTASA